MKLLITGVPATGKTTVGNYLQANNSFHHVDMEANDWLNKREFLENPLAFIKALEQYDDVVITWGFQPFEDVDAIRRLTNNGFNLLWFDGNRERAAKVFVNRDRHDPIAEDRFWAQVGAINESEVMKTLDPKVVDVFNNKGFKSTALVSFALRHPLPNLPFERLIESLSRHLPIPTSLQH